MQQTAQLIVSSYDSEKINNSFKKLMSLSNKINISVQGKPCKYKPKKSKNSPIIWGCDERNVKRKSVHVNGTITDLTKLIMTRTTSGVYVQLIPTQ